MEIFVLENRNSNSTHTQLGWVKILQYRWLGYSNSQRNRPFHHTQFSNILILFYFASRKKQSFISFYFYHSQYVSCYCFGFTNSKDIQAKLIIVLISFSSQTPAFLSRGVKTIVYMMSVDIMQTILALFLSLS